MMRTAKNGRLILGIAVALIVLSLLVFSGLSGEHTGADAMPSAASTPPTDMSRVVSLTFDAAVPGTIGDTSGRGTGFTNRLPGTGANLPASDPNLDLSANPGRLTMTSTHFDIRTGGYLEKAEALGVKLTGIGTGDFRVSALFRGVHVSEPSDQLLLYIGTSARQAFRTGMQFTASREYVLVQNSSGWDYGLQRVGTFSDGDDVRVTIARSGGGAYNVTYENLTRPQNSASDSVILHWLDAALELYAGVSYANNAGGAADNAKTSQIDEFSVDLASPASTLTPTPTATATPAPVATPTPGIIPFAGKTNQGKPVSFDVLSDFSAVTRFHIEYELDCHVTAVVGFADFQASDASPVANRRFQFLSYAASDKYDTYAGRFDSTFATVQGTWKKWLVGLSGSTAYTLCSSFGTWSASPLSTPTPTVTATPAPALTATPTPIPTGAARIQLSAGWNLISAPSPQQDPSISTIFAQAPAVTKVYTFQDGNWVYASRLTEGWGGNLTQLVDGKGYFVYATAPATLTLNPRPADPLAQPPSYPLPAGWNMIGYTSSMATRPVDNYLAPLQGKWTSLFRYGAINAWELAKPGGIGFQAMEQGSGYWIYLTSAGILVP